MRDDAVYCTKCGVKLSSSAAENMGAQVSDVPLITLAPVDKFYSKKNLKKAGIAAGSIVGLVVVVIGVLLVMAMLQNNPGIMGSKFEESEVSRKVYSDCLALVADVRNDNIDSLMKDLINEEGQADNYKFMSTYEALFKEARGEDPTEFEVKFSQCSFMVAYTEFNARKFEYYRDNMLFGNTVSQQADEFRQHADYLYDILVNASTDVELQSIIDYCAENDIITIKG